MRVCVEGHGYGRVAQKFLHDLGVHAPTEQQRGARMMEVVEADLRQAGLLEKRLEGPIDEVLRVDGRADVGSEDQVAVS